MTSTTQIRLTKEKGPDVLPQEMQDQILKNVTELIKTGKMFRYELAPSELETSVTGEVARLERDFAQFMGRKYCIAVNSCGSGMFMALKAGGLKPGMKVFTNAFTFTAVPSCIVHAEGEPVLVESTRRFTMDISDLRKKISQHPDCKFMVLSHMRGHINEMDTIMDLAKEHGIFIVDDCAHAHGAFYDNKRVGSFGPPVACFSAQSMKMLNSGEGGLVITDDDHIAAYCMIGAGCYEGNFSRHLTVPSKEAIEALRYVVPCYSMRMTALSATVLRPQVPFIVKKTEIFRSLYARLEEKLNSLPGIEVPQPVEKARRAPNSMQFLLLGVDKGQTEAFLKKCSARGLSMQIFGMGQNARYYKNWLYAYKDKEVPVCKETDEVLWCACDLRLCLQYTPADVDIIGKIIEEEINELRRNKA